jgi:hypothetical protein
LLDGAFQNIPRDMKIFNFGVPEMTLRNALTAYVTRNKIQLNGGVELSFEPNVTDNKNSDDKTGVGL